MLVGFGINCDGLHAHFAACANDAKRDLAAISYENFVKQLLYLQNEQRLAIFNRMSVLYQNLHDLA